MNILLTAHGSRGDVHPMIALGRGFVSLGHQVSMLTQPVYRERLAEAGLTGIYTSEDMKAEMAMMGGGWKGIRRMMDWSRKSLEQEFALLEDASGRADCVVSTNQEFSVASIAEWRRIPAFRLSYIPAIPGDHAPPLVPWQNLPVGLNRLIWKGFGAGLDSLAKKSINAWRLSRGLRPVRSLTPHMTSVFHTLYGFSSRLAPPHPSWNPEVYEYCGYCFEADDGEPLPADLEAFLQDGEPPLYFGFGSVSVPDPDGCTRLALEAARRANCRIIISRGWTGLGAPGVLGERDGWAEPDRVFVSDEVSHDRLFPRCAGICHHGGAGTTHRAARSGVPQFIMPVFIDQHFWAGRVHGNGVGPAPCPPKALNVDRLTDAFVGLVSGMAYREAAGRLARSVSGDGGTMEAIRIILERIARKESTVA